MLPKNKPVRLRYADHLSDVISQNIDCCPIGEKSYLECRDNPFRDEVVVPEWDFKSIDNGGFLDDYLDDILDVHLFFLSHRNDEMFSLDSVIEQVNSDEEYLKDFPFPEIAASPIESSKYQTLYLINPLNPTEWFGCLVFTLSAFLVNDTLTVKLKFERVYIKPEYKNDPIAYIAAYELGTRLGNGSRVNEQIHNAEQVKVIIENDSPELESVTRRLALAYMEIVNRKTKAEVFFKLNYALPENHIWKRKMEIKTREGKEYLEGSKYSFSESFDVDGEKCGHVNVMHDGQLLMEFEFQLKDVLSTVVRRTKSPLLSRPCIEYRAVDNSMMFNLEFDHYDDYLLFHGFYKIEEKNKDFVLNNLKENEKYNCSVMWHGHECAIELSKESPYRLAVAQPVEFDDENEEEVKVRKGKLISDKYSFKKIYKYGTDEIYNKISMNLTEHRVDFAEAYIDISAVNFSAKLINDVARPIIELQNGTIILDSYDDYLELSRHYNLEPSPSVLEEMIRLSHTNVAAWKACELVDVRDKSNTV